MNLTLNLERTFIAVVNVHHQDDSGKPKKGSFEATFKVLPSNKIEEHEEARLLDLVLVSVNEDHLKIADGTGKKLTGDALIEGLKNDPAVSAAMVSTYTAEVAKKNLKRT